MDIVSLRTPPRSHFSVGDLPAVCRLLPVVVLLCLDPRLDLWAAVLLQAQRDHDVADHLRLGPRGGSVPRGPVRLQDQKLSLPALAAVGALADVLQTPEQPLGAIADELLIRQLPGDAVIEDPELPELRCPEAADGHSLLCVVGGRQLERRQGHLLLEDRLAALGQALPEPRLAGLRVLLRGQAHLPEARQPLEERLQLRQHAALRVVVGEVQGEVERLQAQRHRRRQAWKILRPEFTADERQDLQARQGRQAVREGLDEAWPLPRVPAGVEAQLAELGQGAPRCAVVVVVVGLDARGQATHVPVGAGQPQHLQAPRQVLAQLQHSLEVFDVVARQIQLVEACHCVQGVHQAREAARAGFAVAARLLLPDLGQPPREGGEAQVLKLLQAEAESPVLVLLQVHLGLELVHLI
mmetsp:Transcript_20237/g.63395  ORF Transcript_20237/g.63395 Transcript_20237/m.63395 type:complete len:411 (+) Transcript_20237:172-1404(+)